MRSFSDWCPMSWGSCPAAWFHRHPHGRKGGGRRRVDDRTILAAIVYVATTGYAWRQLPPVFGASWQTVHRR
ncbi:hypothetical protein C1J01_04645, partial [Nonomuraea aridisoli]